MDLSLLKALSEADAIASSEQEVRQILREEADRLQKEVRFDGLGSVLIRLNESTGPKVMICAHMDEVGFMVRSISREGAFDVLPVGKTPGVPFASFLTYKILHQFKALFRCQFTG